MGSQGSRGGRWTECPSGSIEAVSNSNCNVVQTISMHGSAGADMGLCATMRSNTDNAYDMLHFSMDEHASCKSYKTDAPGNGSPPPFAEGATIVFPAHCVPALVSGELAAVPTPSWHGTVKPPARLGSGRAGTADSSYAPSEAGRHTHHKMYKQFIVMAGCAINCYHTLWCIN